MSVISKVFGVTQKEERIHVYRPRRGHSDGYINALKASDGSSTKKNRKQEQNVRNSCRSKL